MMNSKFTLADLESPNILAKYLTKGQYRTEMHTKRSVFLHHTAGPTAQGAWDWWNKTPERVGVPYIIDRDGSIWECFDPAMWAPHLGVKGHPELDMNSIGIEIVSWGQLKPTSDPDKFLTYTGKPIGILNTTKVKWRGEQYFHEYTEEQILSLMKLLYYLHKRFPSLVFESPKKFYEYQPEVVERNTPGLWSHTSVRKDKLDIFPQATLLQAIGQLKSLF